MINIIESQAGIITYLETFMVDSSNKKGIDEIKEQFFALVKENTNFKGTLKSAISQGSIDGHNGYNVTIYESDNFKVLV